MTLVNFAPTSYMTPKFLEPAEPEPSAAGCKVIVRMSESASFTPYEITADILPKADGEALLQITIKAYKTDSALKYLQKSNLPKTLKLQKTFPRYIAEEIKDVIVREAKNARKSDDMGLDGATYSFAAKENGMLIKGCIWSPQYYNPNVMTRLFDAIVEYAIVGDTKIPYLNLPNDFRRNVGKMRSDKEYLDAIRTLLKILDENKNLKTDPRLYELRNFDKFRSHKEMFDQLHYERGFLPKNTDIKIPFKNGVITIKTACDVPKISTGLYREIDYNGTHFIYRALGNGFHTVAQDGIYGISAYAMPKPTESGKILLLRYAEWFLNFDNAEDFEKWARSNSQFHYDSNGLCAFVEEEEFETETYLNVSVFQFLIRWEAIKSYPPSPLKADFEIMR